MRFVCVDCGTDLGVRGRGRPPSRCRDCKTTLAAEKQRAYYDANKDVIAEKKRRERECSGCGETMRAHSETGLCGFCTAEREAA